MGVGDNVQDWITCLIVAPFVLKSENHFQIRNCLTWKKSDTTESAGFYFGKTLKVHHNETQPDDVVLSNQEKLFEHELSLQDLVFPCKHLLLQPSLHTKSSEVSMITLYWIPITRQVSRYFFVLINIILLSCLELYRLRILWNLDKTLGKHLNKQTPAAGIVI